MSSREALISALAVVAFGAAASGTPAEARTDPASVCKEIAVTTNPGDLRRHLGDPDCGAPAVARLLALQGFTQVAQASGDPNLQLCLYRPDDPRYRTDPRCPPLAMPTTTGSGSGSSSSSTPPPNNGYPG
jgi:hypothetical protein